jgi:hypothetical protein
MTSVIVLPPRPRRWQRQSLLLLQLCVALLLGGSSLVQLRIVSKVTERLPPPNDSDARFPRSVPKVPLWWSDLQATENSAIVDENRQIYRNSSFCQDEAGRLIDWFVPPSPLMEPFPKYEDTVMPKTRAVKACRFSFLDLGAQVGDSLGKLIDTSVGSACPAQYNMTDGWMHALPIPRTPSKLTQWIAKQMRDFQWTHQGRSRGGANARAPEDMARPEQYCYYGVESNPKFTEPLQQIQHRVLATKPRPLRSVYFYTETVVSGTGDDPTNFYLDSVHPRSADVTTLSTLVQQVVRWEAGAHLVIQMDLAGAEYAVLNEAWDSRVLCDCVASGVRIDIRAKMYPQVGELYGVILTLGKHVFCEILTFIVFPRIFYRKPLVKVRIWIALNTPCGAN